ncbi:MAG: hypothetical protein PUP92_13035 [Rhizonema sp. PD38]|nr:hypothetical protein [Rhizonema sp. PD38]
MVKRKTPKSMLGESSNSSLPPENESKYSTRVPVEVVELEELSEEEVRDLLHLERRVERSFYECGKALMELRNRRLYRSTHRTFEDYCHDRFGFTHRNVNYLIAGSMVVDNLKVGTNGSQIHDETETNCSQILPANERQVRPLTKLEPDQQRQVWQLSVEEAGGKVPSGRIVKDIVQRVMERATVSNPFLVGEVCQIVAKDNPELRGKGGCWCIVSQVNDFSCTVTAWDGQYSVRMDHLKSLEYSDANCAKMKEVWDRISRLRNSGLLEEAAYAYLKHLGEVKRPYLTPLEEKLLALIEQEYVDAWIRK